MVFSYLLYVLRGNGQRGLKRAWAVPNSCQVRKFKMFVSESYVEGESHHLVVPHPRKASLGHPSIMTA